VPVTWPESPFIAEAVEEVPRVGNFETMIQKPGRCWINVASGSAYENDSYTKSVGSDFFDSLGYEQTSSHPKSISALPPKADILVAVTDFRL
jgi:hypothetical protein